MSPLSDFGSLTAELARGGEHLGDFVLWSLDDARQEVSTVERAFRQEGLDAHLPEPPGWFKAHKRAFEDARRGKPKETILTLAREESGELVFAVLHKAVDFHGDVTTTQEGKLRYTGVEGRGGSPSWAGSDLGHPIVAEIHKGAVDLATRYTGEDVGKAIVSALKALAAFSLRPAGGVYFVPRTSAVEVRRLQKAVAGVGKCALSIIPVHRSGEGTPALAQAAQGSLEAEVQAVGAEIMAFAQEVQEGGDGPRAHTLERRLARFDEIRARAKVYEAVLTFQAQGITESLTKLETIIAAIVETMAAKENT